MSLPLAIADALVKLINSKSFERISVRAEAVFVEDFTLAGDDGTVVHVMPTAMESQALSRGSRLDAPTITILIMRRLDENEQRDSSQFRELDALAEEIFNLATLQRLAGATWQGTTWPALFDPERLKTNGLYLAAIQCEYKRAYEKSEDDEIEDPAPPPPEPEPEPDPDPDPTPDPDPEPTPELQALPSIVYGNRFVDIGDTEDFGSIDKTAQLQWLYQVHVPIGADYGWADAAGGTHLRSGRHELSDGKTAARTRFQAFFDEIGAANEHTLRGVYWGLKGVRTDAEHAALAHWPCSNSNFERDWDGDSTYLEPWLYDKGYSGTWKVKIAEAGARQQLLDILLGTYLGPGKLYDFDGLRLFHLDEMGATNNANAFSAAEWSGIAAFCQEFKPALAALGIRFSGNVGGHGMWSASNPWFAPSYFSDLATMVHLLQQERLPGPKASLSTAAIQQAIANIRQYVFSQGLALELHPGLTESDMHPAYTITAVQEITAESGWPHNVPYLRDGDKKLLLTLDQPAHAWDWIAETWGYASYLGDKANELSDLWPRDGWCVVKGPSANQVLCGRLEGDADAVRATIGGGFAWSDLVGQKLRTSTHWPRIQAAYGLMAIRTQDDVFANHSSAASSSVNAYLYAASGEPGVGPEQNWMRWADILGKPLGEPTYVGDLASGYAGRVRREFQNGRLDLEPDLGLVTIDV